MHVASTSIHPILIGVVAAGLAVTACGSDDGPEPLSKPEFVEQADAICQASIDEAEPVFESVWVGLDDVDLDDPANQTVVFEHWADAIDDLLPLFERQLDDIRALAPPAEDRELIETLLDDQEAALAEFDRLIDAAAAGDESAMAALDGDDPFTDVDRRAREYGLTVCGNDG